MLCIEDSAQNAFVAANFGDSWLGLSDAVQEGTWVWNTGCDSSFLNWDAGPGPHLPRSNCAHACRPSL